MRVPSTSHQARINQSIDLDSPKVATQDMLTEGGKKVYCRCWQSGTFPLCDGAHVAHNKETGDNVGPLILSAAAASIADDADGASSVSVVEEKKSILGKLGAMFKKEKNDDGLTTKERLAKLGLSALLSYGWVSLGIIFCCLLSIHTRVYSTFGLWIPITNSTNQIYAGIKYELCGHVVLVLVWI